jgi:hypothetical protein
LPCNSITRILNNQMRKIDITNIKDWIGNYLKSAIRIFKEIAKLPKAKFYIFLSIVLIIFFIVITFPYEILVRNQIHKLETQLGSNINIGEIDFSLWDSIFMDNIYISSRDGTDIILKNLSIDISLNPYTIFIKKTIRGDISIRGMRYLRRETSADGIVKCKFDINMDNTNGFVNLDLQNVRVNGVVIKGFDIPPVKFTSIQAETVIYNSELKINKFTFSGIDLRGRIQGAMTIAKLMRNSKMNINIEIDKNSRILEDYKILIGNYTGHGDNLKIELSGLISRPRINFPGKSPEQ